MSDRIPVTVVSGGLGAGKTTLLNHLLERADRRLAVLVNDMGDVNVDAALLEGESLSKEGIAELSNGCICCELQGDLESEVRALAGRYDFDHLIVESSGISEPAPVARLFTAGPAAARYEVDALVTVVDATVLSQVVDGESLERETPPDAEDRPLSDLLVEQIEVSNVVLLNKVDLIDEDERERLTTIIRALQPDAEIIETTYSTVDPDDLLGRGLFDANELGELAGWQRALAHAHGDHDHEKAGHRAHDSGEDEHESHDHAAGHGDATHTHRTPESVYGVESRTYRRFRPFDPDAFVAVLQELPKGVIRCKGPCWVAGHDDTVMQLSGAGRTIDVVAEGPWIATLPAAQRDLYRENHPEIPWDDDHGDRRTELVFIGPDLEWDDLVAALDDCLVEPATTPDGRDPFPNTVGERVVLRSE